MNKYNNHYLKDKKNWSSENTIRDTCSRYIGADFLVPIYKLNQIMHKVEITWISVIFFYFNKKSQMGLSINVLKLIWS